MSDRRKFIKQLGGLGLLLGLGAKDFTKADPKSLREKLETKHDPPPPPVNSVDRDKDFPGKVKFVDPKFAEEGGMYMSCGMGFYPPRGGFSA